MARFKSLYGASLLHLIAVIASFAAAAYGFLRIFDSSAPESTMLFFIAAIFAHDLVAFPLYTALNRLACLATGEPTGRRLSGRQLSPLNYLRVPAVLSAFCLLLFFPLILRLSADRFMANSGESADVFLGRWFGIVAVLFTASGVLYAIRLRRVNRVRSVAVAERASDD